jgi:hypothetical protein
MPGLPRGIARAAVIAGTATAVSNRVGRRQEGRYAEQEQQQWEQQQPQMATQQYAPPAAGPVQDEDPVKKLERLGELHQSGVLTDQESASAKAKVLNV